MSPFDLLVACALIVSLVCNISQAAHIRNLRDQLHRMTLRLETLQGFMNRQRLRPPHEHWALLDTSKPK